MPYLNGDRTVDASGNGLIDAAANVLQTPPFDFSQLVSWVNGISALLTSPTSGWLWAVGLIGAATGWTERVKAVTDYIYNSGLQPAIEPSPQYIASRVGNLYNWGVDWNTVLPAGVPALAAMFGSPGKSLEQVYNHLEGTPEIVLPATPPAGYGGATPTEIWGHYLNGIAAPTRTADEAVSQAWLFVQWLNENGGLPVNRHPHFQWDVGEGINFYYPTDALVLTYDLTDIHADDTVLSWLTRTDTSGRTWTQDATTGLVYTEDNLGNERFSRVTCRLTDADLQAIRAGYARTSSPVSGVPPVWPGIANVTLGTPVPFTGSLTVTATMHGVLVNVTTPPQKLSQIVIGGENYDYRVGEITFESDNGQQEPFQYLGFRTAVFTPRFMVEAAKAHLRVLGGAEGTVTPWTIAV